MPDEKYKPTILVTEQENKANTILVVEDEPSLLSAIARLLRKAGYQVSQAANGQEALRLAAELNPDLILLDVTLPDIDGFQVCQRVKTDPALSGSHVVFLSASRMLARTLFSILDGFQAVF